jgi:hypothetical protein
MEQLIEGGLRPRESLAGRRHCTRRSGARTAEEEAQRWDIWRPRRGWNWSCGGSLPLDDGLSPRPVISPS